MKLHRYRVIEETGVIEIAMKKEDGSIWRTPVDPLNDFEPKNRLVEYLGQNIADDIETQYWSEES